MYRKFLIFQIPMSILLLGIIYLEPAIFKEFVHSNTPYVTLSLTGINTVPEILFIIKGRNDIISSLKSYTVELWKEENLIDISTPSFITLNINTKNPKSINTVSKLCTIIKKKIYLTVDLK